MRNAPFPIEAKKPFAESLIWQLNQDYYKNKGIDAWRKGEVPHNLTSSSMVGKTYAELIFAFLKDLANKGQIQHTVYILELGAGHGRLAFHILKHLEQLKAKFNIDLPPYCYVLSDIAEDNLSFFQNHPQFQSYLEKGLLDVAYFNAMDSKEIDLRHSKRKITSNDLEQPLLVLANYFFDSIPNDLFHLKDRVISECWLALDSKVDPAGLDEATLLKALETNYSMKPMKTPFYEEAILNEILEEYRQSLFNTYLFFPQKGLQCLENIEALSKKGMVVISMDKGGHEIRGLENKKDPDMVTHGGSFSFLVNYHALGAYCEKKGGIANFPSDSNNSIEVACLMFLPDSESYTQTSKAYQKYVNDYGPDDFNTLKNFSYKHVERMSLEEIIGLLRLGAYDSTLFNNFLPRIKQVSKEVSYNQRTALADTMNATWNMYFTLNEAKDLAFEIGGMFYQLGYYQPALNYFQLSTNQYGQTADGFYNQALCYYQLRADEQFKETLKEANVLFPDFKAFAHLNTLDLGAA